MEEIAPKREKPDVNNLICIICQEESSPRTLRIDIFAV